VATSGDYYRVRQFEPPRPREPLRQQSGFQPRRPGATIGGSVTLPTRLVEVRVPTFNRPGLLRRALESLLAQTWPDWRAIVLDDGNGERTRAVLDDLRDRRLVHRPNPARLGAAGNIGQAFSNVPYVGGAHFAVLEDDNSWHREFLARNVAIMDAHDVRIVQSNQWIEEPETREAPGRISAATTLGDCTPRGDGAPNSSSCRCSGAWRSPTARCSGEATAVRTCAPMTCPMRSCRSG
jgi:hypothetical protein